MNMSACLTGLLICFSLVTSDAECLFMCLSAGIPQRNVHFDLWHILFFLVFNVFLILSCMSCLYVFKMNSLWVSSFADISSYSDGCPCLPLRVSFKYAKAFKVNSVLFSDLWLIFHFSKR